MSKKAESTTSYPAHFEGENSTLSSIGTFSIEQVARDSEPFGNYNYEIHVGSKLLARYWHDFRGEEHGLVFPNGKREEWPVGKMTGFLMGGGPISPQLSEAAIEFLTKKLLTN